MKMKTRTGLKQLLTTPVCGLLAGILVLVTLGGSVSAQSLAYIANINDSTVSVIDTSTDTVIATIPLGPLPWAVAVHPDGSRVYVTTIGNFNDVIRVIDTEDNTVIATVPSGQEPRGIAVHPDGSRVYVANLSSDTLAVIDTATNTRIAVLATSSGPRRVAVDPLGRWIYVTTSGFIDSVSTNRVDVFDASTNMLTSQFSLGASSARGIAVSPDGARIYVVAGGTNTLWVLEPDPALPGSLVEVDQVFVAGTCAVAVHPDGSRVYAVGIGSGGRISVIDAVTHATIATLSLGQARGVSVHPDGTRIYVTLSVLDVVAVIDTATNTLIATVPVGDSPFSNGIFITPCDAPVDAVPPTANAGPDQSIHAGQAVDLDGTASFDDTTATEDLQFAWSFSATPTSSVATLSGANSATPCFVADVPGEFRTQLVVTDEAGNASAPGEVIISSLNMAPTAVAGDGQVVVLNTAASLDGLGSTDPDGDPFGFSWTIGSAPGGSMAGLADPTTGTPSLTPDLAGTYVIRLIVNDGFVDSEPDTVTITAITGAAFAEFKLKAACDLAAGLASASFDAPGHRNYFCNMSSKVIHFLQTSNIDQAQAHLATMISRSDGCSLRSMADPKGAGQPHAADFITDCEAQQQLYQLLNDASSVL